MTNRTRRILVTGGRGYLPSLLIKQLMTNRDVKFIVEIDPKNGCASEEMNGRLHHVSGNILNKNLNLQGLMEKHLIDTVIHAAWAFNPRRDPKEQWELDLKGTEKVFFAALESPTVEHFVYLGSTTAYGQFPREEKPLKEEEYKSWTECDGKTFNSHEYQYSVDKSVVDEWFQNWTNKFGQLMNIFWMRGAIVLGPSIPLNNVVADMAKTFGPVMFRVAGYNPPMQFVSEYDMTQILYRAIMDKWSGVVNVAGYGTIRYSEIIKLLGKKEIALPFWILRPICGLLWKLNLVPFPPAILNLIMYPWLGDITKLKKTYNYKPWHNSAEAVCQLAVRLKKS